MSGTKLATVAILVRDYDEAARWYGRVLGLGVLQDVDLGSGKRWLIVGEAGGKGARMLLALACTPREIAAVGDQFGGRVGLFLETSDFDSCHAHMLAEGVLFEEAPRTEPYAKVAVFRDLYGNRWDLLQPA